MFHSSTTPVVGGTLRWAWKTHFFNTIWKEIDHFGGPVFWLKRSSLGTSDIQDCCYPKGITYIIIIHEGDPIACKTTYIEYRSPVKSIHQFFEGMPPKSISFHCKLFFFHSSPTPFVGGTLRWAWKTHFFNTIWKEIDHVGGAVFFLKRSSLRTSDIQGCYSPKGITYLIIIHEGDPIPCRTTYIEYRSPVKIFINFWRNAT